VAITLLLPASTAYKSVTGVASVALKIERERWRSMSLTKRASLRFLRKVSSCVMLVAANTQLSRPRQFSHYGCYSL